MKGKRVQIILTEEMVTALREVADKQNSNVSAMVRLALADWLQENQSIELNHRLAWGGDRTASN